MNQVTHFLAEVQIGDPQTYRNMVIYPLYVQNGHERDYQTIDEAMAAQSMQVEEISESGSVPTLAVKNQGGLPVLLVLGEELIGAKQNRVLNTSLLVPARSQIQIPVSCVEQGRWSYQSRGFSSSTTSSHLGLRRSQSESVTQNLRAKADYDADQRRVWAEVDRKMSSHHISSSTRALRDVYDNLGNEVQAYLNAFAAPNSQGMLVAINGSVVGGDIFDHAETLQHLWPKLVRSYALDAVEREGQPTEEQDGSDSPSAFLGAAQKAAEESYSLVGLGTDVRLSSEKVTGSALVWQDYVIHASLFSRRGAAR